MSSWTSTPLPSTATLPSPCDFRSRAADTRSPPSTWEFDQVGLVSVRVTTYFGVALRCAAIGFSSGWLGQ